MPTSHALSYLQTGDTVEDRSLSTGHGHVVYLRGNSAYVRYHDGSEEEINCELFVHYDARHWII